MRTSVLPTAKCTSAPPGNERSGSGDLPAGAGKAVEAVLVHRVVHALREVGLELGRGDGDAVEEQH
jgi:hypothetical protein